MLSLSSMIWTQLGVGMRAQANFIKGFQYQSVDRPAMSIIEHRRKMMMVQRLESSQLGEYACCCDPKTAAIGDLRQA